MNCQEAFFQEIIALILFMKLIANGVFTVESILKMLLKLIHFPLTFSTELYCISCYNYEIVNIFPATHVCYVLNVKIKNAFMW